MQDDLDRKLDGILHLYSVCIHCSNPIESSVRLHDPGGWWKKRLLDAEIDCFEDRKVGEDVLSVCM